MVKFRKFKVKWLTDSINVLPIKLWPLNSRLTLSWPLNSGLTLSLPLNSGLTLPYLQIQYSYCKSTKKWYPQNWLSMQYKGYHCLELRKLIPAYMIILQNTLKLAKINVCLQNFLIDMFIISDNLFSISSSSYYKEENKLLMKERFNIYLST